MLETAQLTKLANTSMPFGRYQGRMLIDLPEEYLLWFSHREFPKGELGLLMQLALLVRSEGLETLVHPLRRHK